MSAFQGHPDSEVCGRCEGDRIRLSKGAIVCPKCDLIKGRVTS